MPDKYPIGEQNFAKIRNHDLLYVDKTAYIHRMVTSGSAYYFLSRPRRFGKSLLISTLEQYFKGNRDLFQGLAIDKLQPEPWPRHTVLHLDFNRQQYSTPQDLKDLINDYLVQWEQLYGSRSSEGSLTLRFLGVIERAHATTGNGVVILIDEYDKPLLDAMDDPELEEINRQTLKSFYGAMKSAQDALRFVMLTGVGKIAQLNVFSGLNNIRDISMVNEYAGICGITEEELHSDLQKGVDSMAQEHSVTTENVFGLLKRNYDGYHFSKKLLDVYNPYSLLTALADKEIGDYWYRTGTPTHLIKVLKKDYLNIKNIEGVEVDGNKLLDGNVVGTDPIPVLFYSGYLTIKKWEPEFGLYQLGFPNLEVKRGFLGNVLDVLANDSKMESTTIILRMRKALMQNNVSEFLKLLKPYIARFDYAMDAANEYHYQDIFYAISFLLGFQCDIEVHTSKRRIDMVLGTKTHVYLMEFKLNTSAAMALEQINDRGYAIPFELDGRKIVKVGINFSSKTNTISDWQIEE